MPALIDCIKPLLKVHPRLVDNLRELSRETEHEVYLVGGCVRDAILGRTVHDLDLTLAGDGLRQGEALAARLRCPFVPLYDAARTGRIVLRRRYTIDIASFKGPTLEDDLSKRDFTVNAMAVRLADVLDGQPSIIDPCDGAIDLASRRLKAISRDSFHEDPLRMLRAHRLAGQYNLDITPETAAWIKECNEGLRNVSGERLLYEIALTLRPRSTADRISAMIGTGVFEALFPGWTGPATPVLVRSLERTDRLIVRDVFCEDHSLYAHLPGYASKLAGNRSSLWILRLASLVLHFIREKGREPALVLVEQTADRLKLSNRERQSLHQLTLGAKRLLERVASRIPLDDDLCRILRTAKDETPGVALLALAHGTEAGSHAAGHVGDAIKRLLRLYSRYRKVRATGLLLNGMDIMGDLNIPAGPEIGRMLDKLGNIQVLHDIRTREEARKLLYDAPDTAVAPPTVR